MWHTARPAKVGKGSSVEDGTVEGLPDPPSRRSSGTYDASLGRERSRELWWRWFAAATTGEFLGFVVPAAMGAATSDAAMPITATVMLIAGAIEGGVLGWFQARVLRSVIAGFHSAEWIVATVSGALVAWSLGVVPMLTDGFADLSVFVVVPAVVLGGAVLLLSIGVAQWAVLRRYVSGAARWILATALAWAGGLAAFTAFTTPLWQPGQPYAVVVLIGVVGGVLMAAVMAAITGWFLVRLLSPSPEGDERPAETGPQSLVGGGEA
ncbi:hypothetical protein [Nocardia bovistercoris]|uniref:Uncharacterized protein n=1 Tax=Nocardia bovistercoris TaxID=2785916 RepID=A0A931IJG4_9NOCA|nr:hypothetical protein [Nocardia bovistercoris]MBH0781738.1 hypothetical protein [Nocardia bovistercoris]